MKTAAACDPDGGDPNVGLCVATDGGAPRACRIAPPKDGDAAAGTTTVALAPDLLREAGPDAPLDAPWPQDDAPSDTRDAPICVGSQPVWNDDSASFSLTSSYLWGPTQVPDGGCSTNSSTYVFSKSLRTLDRYGCVNGQNGRAAVELADAQVNQIVAAVEVLRTTCWMNCAADAPRTSLTVNDCASQRQGAFWNNVWCSGPPRTDGPHVSINELLWLTNVLDGILRSSCDATDGGAGMCGTFCRLPR